MHLSDCLLNSNSAIYLSLTIMARPVPTINAIWTHSCSHKLGIDLMAGTVGVEPTSTVLETVILPLN